jgi:HEAT repeat protein
MRISAKVLPARLLVVSCPIFLLSGAVAAALDKADIDKKLAAIVSYERGMNRQPLIAVEELIRESQNQPEQRKYVERRLAELLADATLEAKSFICKQLWFIGTADSVPAVAKLLTDENTVDMACYAIGQNPSPEAGKALRDALGKTGPNVQVRIINLLGDRRDTRSVEAVGKLVFSAERQVAEAAVAALGKIGGAKAREILVQARAKGDSDLRFAATDAYLRCAEDLAAAGKTKQAIVIYKELAGKDEAAVIRSAAIKGLADVAGRDAVPVVVAALHDENRMVRMTAVGCVRTMPGMGVTERFAAELPKMPLSEQVLLIGALANRQDHAALPAITTAARSASVEVRTAAMYALGHFGGTSCVELLVQAVDSNTPEERKAAIFALKNIGGTGTDDAIVKSMQNSRPSVRSQLIQVLFDRNAVGAVPALLGEAANADTKVCRAAFKALGRLAGANDLPSLVELLVKMQDEAGRREAERAVIAVSRKISDENGGADAILAALSTEKRVPVRCSLLRVLGGIANSRALKTVEAASKDTDAAVSDTAVRALAKWPDVTAAEVLLDIYCEAQNQIHRLLALRGFVRLLAFPAGGRPAQKTLEMCRQAMSRTRSPEEKKLVLSGLASVADPKALTMVEPFLQTEAVRAEAAMAAVRIAGAIVRTHPDKAKPAMNRLLAVLQNQELRKQAEEILRQIEESAESNRDTER